MLAQETRNLPFDTRTFHVITYDRAEGDVLNPDELATDILQSLDKIPQIPMTEEIKARSPEEFLYQRIPNAKNRSVHLWKKSGNHFVLSDIELSAYRVALALLRTYPSPAMVKSIAKETRLSRPRVSQILHGTYSDTDKFFEKKQSKWTLSDEGIYWTINEVVRKSIL